MARSDHLNVHVLPRTRSARLLAVALAAAAVTGLLAAISLRGVEQASPPARGEALAGAGDVRALYAGIPQHGLSLGRPDAPVTLVEFADLQCPFCARYASETLPEIVRRYVRPGRVRIELRPLRFLGADSVRAAGFAAAAAAQDRLFQLSDLFYRNQGSENSGYVTDHFLRRLGAATPGLDVGRAMRERAGDSAEILLGRAESDAQRAGISSTPSLLAGPTRGRLEPLAPGALSVSDLSAELDRLLAR